MSKLQEVLGTLPDAKGCVVVLSGGMDSTIALRLAIAKYGVDNVAALTYFYGQKQAIEIEKAKTTTANLGVKHKILDVSILGDIAQGFSANVDKNIAMPTIKEILGDPTPKTYVPNRNMILMSFAAAYAEVNGLDTILMGLQAQDEYSYHDTTSTWVSKLNNLLAENRKIKISLIAPFSSLSKQVEIALLQELDGNTNLLINTLTCYNPNEHGESCGKCPSCAERIKAFMVNNLVDPIPYSVDIPWRK